MKKLIITAALSGAGTSKKQAPTVPITAREIAEEVIAVAKAGAAIAHIHVRDDEGYGTMKTEKFREAVELTRELMKKEKVDIIINLTTSGGVATDDLRLAHLKELKPEMCSYDAGTMNWGNSFIFENSPKFLEKLGETTIKYNIKPEVEIFDGSMLGNANYYIKKGFLKTSCHFQFVLGVPGGLDATVRNLNFLYEMLPKDSTWSVTGIGKGHLPMLLTGLALGADGVRVGLEDNVLYSPSKVTTNVELVERAVRLAKEAGREIATPAEAREILNITK